jgi:hypothetical protein
LVEIVAPGEMVIQKAETASQPDSSSVEQQIQNAPEQIVEEAAAETPVEVAPVVEIPTEEPKA